MISGTGRRADATGAGMPVLRRVIRLVLPKKTPDCTDRKKDKAIV
jgi:hypothetical protein